MPVVSVLPQGPDETLHIVTHYLIAVDQFRVEIGKYRMWWLKMKEYCAATEERLIVALK
jgi:hypothetical protein